ncbi:MAG: Stp1/IreP family PP2C-type Ser/Thr phosphatase [Caldisericia bacterium]|nr:Stp1/IreP family PP2C-type Ser/Thr phosphatase [Caldisericia bacterium]
MMRKIIFTYGKSDIGNVRENNEDNYLILSKENFTVLCVCDGMGGHRAGEVASSLAIEYLKDFVYQRGDFAITWRGEEEESPSPELIFSDKNLIEFCKKLNEKIFDKSISNNNYKGMGTTFNAVFIIDKNAKILNIGDSRTYLIRKNSILRLTKDHSLFQEEMDKGLIDKEEMENIIPKNVITKAIGIKEDVEPDIYSLSLEKNDRLILVTDGIHDLLSDEEIYKIMGKGKLETCVKKLINKGKEKGGFDNMTVVIALINI